MQAVISYPVSPEDILNLHEALQALMPPNSDVFKPAGDFPTREHLVKLARRVGMEGEAYGADTGKAVAFFQQQEGLETRRPGALDPATADKMNQYLKDIGAFDEPDQRVVAGMLRLASGAPVNGASVCVFDASGSRTVVLNRGVTDNEGRYELPFLFADGHVQFIRDSIPLTTLAALCTMNANEVVPANY